MEIQGQDFPAFHDSLEISQTARDFHICHSSGGQWLIGEKRRSKNPDWVGGGKVEIQKQDSHFSTAPAACGRRKKNRAVSDGRKRDTSIEVRPGTFLKRLDKRARAD